MQTQLETPKWDGIFLFNSLPPALAHEVRYNGRRHYPAQLHRCHGHALELMQHNITLDYTAAVNIYRTLSGNGSCAIWWTLPCHVNLILV